MFIGCSMLATLVPVKPSSTDGVNGTDLSTMVKFFLFPTHTQTDWLLICHSPDSYHAAPPPPPRCTDTHTHPTTTTVLHTPLQHRHIHLQKVGLPQVGILDMDNLGDVCIGKENMLMETHSYIDVFIQVWLQRHCHHFHQDLCASDQTAFVFNGTYHEKHTTDLSLLHENYLLKGLYKGATLQGWQLKQHMHPAAVHS